ncbi:MAG: ATP-binding protein [Planctomycetaceae bacterium]
MAAVIGRDSEKAELDRALVSGQPELIAVYGRRRVGKTFLIREYLANAICFELTGLHNETLPRQLENFSRRLREQTGADEPVPQSWLEAFGQLRGFLSNQRSKQKRVLFFDEFPWLAGRRSGFLSAFEEFWNSFASRDSGIVCIICGSAASWMITKVINAKGGLHNRATATLRLEPFTLAETKEYLQHRRVSLTDLQITQLYTVLGGIPHYLQRVKRGQSAAQTIDELCFTKDGLLAREFDNLYAALFENADRHESVVRVLADTRQGLTRTELVRSASLESGGTLTKVLRELSESGFIREMPALHAVRKNSLLRLTDEYSLFYLKWIETNRMSGADVWLTKSSGQKYKSWCGYAFENLCLKHVPQIKAALGISGVLTEEASWHYRAADDSQQGAQIDLLIDRNDQCINVCEMKFSEAPFTIDKRYAAELRRKLAVFRERSKTNKSIFLTMVTSAGLRQNQYSRELVAGEVTLADLFEPLKRQKSQSAVRSE